VPSWITDASLTALSHCKRLHRLKVENNSFITHIGVNAMSRGCCGLRELELLNCGRIGDAALDAVGQHCPRLQALLLRDNFLATTTGLARMFQKCTELMTLTLVRCKASLPAALDSPLELQCLRYVGTEMCAQPGVAQFVSRCRKLTSLELCNVRELTAADIVEMRLSFAALRMLRVNAGHSPSSENLSALLRHCTALTNLELHSPQVTAAVLQSAADACPGLVSLDVSWCDSLTDAALQALVPGVRALRQLSVKGARHVTERGVRSVITHCRALESVNVQFCPAVRAALLQEDVTAHPGVQLIV
jgi:F-box/leucine-rich repeat protein 2/20